MRVRTEEYKAWAKVHAKKTRAKDPALHRARVKASRLKALAVDPDHYKKMDLKRFYGVTLDWYKQTLEQQRFCCAICGKPESENTQRNGKPLNLSVDHCHTTGLVRGLLCNNCNRAIGMLNHNIDVLNAAIGYLKNHGSLT